MENNIITIAKIREIENDEGRKLFLEKWSLNGFIRYCILQVTPFFKVRGPFYTSNEYSIKDWEEYVKYLMNHLYLTCAAFITDNTISYKVEDISHLEENDENYDLIPKLQEFVYIYRKAINNG